MPWFACTKSTHFSPIAEGDHATSPDIIGGRPGEERPSIYTWPDCGVVFELKVDTDIFKAKEINKNSIESKDALMQIAKSARSLLTSGRCCFVFVVAVIKTMARILRFDRAGFRTSAAFNWTEQSNSHFIPTFLWRLYNPDPRSGTESPAPDVESGTESPAPDVESGTDLPARMYGADETISIPTAAEKEQMFKLWKKTSSYEKTVAAKLLSFEEATRNSRWLEASINNTTVRCFTIGQPLFESEGLFSRATRVDRVVIEDDPTPTVYALKDAWRQVCRRPETDFYDVIAKYCEEKSLPTQGMARCLGSLEFSDPGHETNSAGSPEQERRHIRSLLTPVGIPLKQFPSSRELILALEGVLEHHRVAYEAGVIHRDVSEGNVLFDEETMKGFLVDWDYAEFNQQGSLIFKPGFRKDQMATGTRILTKASRIWLSSFQGTSPFMAIQRLEAQNTPHEAHHDLESFYWLLIWVILRYTIHNHKDGLFACHHLFDVNDPAAIKRSWLTKKTPIADQTSPLYKLTARFRRLVQGQNPVVIELDEILTDSAPTVAPAAEPLTHVDIKTKVFEAVIDQENWAIFEDRRVAGAKPEPRLAADFIETRWQGHNVFRTAASGGPRQGAGAVANDDSS
ncbi:hypothetical protein C8F04DRAFT_1175024 [Mycena alexandri]|uniref:Fungal-type protein kinase domain-containing protein n=1 Tax=Mycena alexandri TaxID=1745969 RepID=A0AAD6TGR9_9AGAR|nr:hypothetical protein C8F04DRAFT_1175024 [Mycena alexandri]